MGQPPPPPTDPFSGVGSYRCHCTYWYRRCQRTSWSRFRGQHQCDNAVRVSGDIDSDNTIDLLVLDNGSTDIDANDPSPEFRADLRGQFDTGNDPTYIGADDHDHQPTTDHNDDSPGRRFRCHITLTTTMTSSSFAGGTTAIVAVRDPHLAGPRAVLAELEVVAKRGRRSLLERNHPR
jgi:hypothetical protein